MTSPSATQPLVARLLPALLLLALVAVERGLRQLRASNRTVTIFTGLAFAAVAAWTFTTLVLPPWIEGFEAQKDYDNYLLAAHRLLQHGEFPVLGPGIAPTRLYLGPLFIYLLAFALWVSGNDLHGAWLVLASLDLVAMVGTGVALVRPLGRGRAAMLVVLLLASPQLHRELNWYFWHHPFLPAFELLTLAALVRFLVLRRPGAWLVAVAGACLAVQMHLTAGVLFVPLAVGAWVGRKALSRSTWLATSAILLVLNAWVLAELDVLFDPAMWRAASAGLSGTLGDPDVHRLLAAGALLDATTVVTAGALLVPAGLIASVALLARRRAPGSPDGPQAVAWVAVSGTLASAGLLFALRHWWSPTYDLVAVPFLAMCAWGALDSADRFIRSEGWPRVARIAQWVVLPLLALNLLRPLRDAPPLPEGPAYDMRVLDDLLTVAAAGGWILLPADATRVHGVATLVPAWARTRFLAHRLGESPAVTAEPPAGGVNVSFDLAGRFEFEPVDPCLATPSQPGDPRPGQPVEAARTPGCLGRPGVHRFVVALAIPDFRALPCEPMAPAMTFEADGHAMAAVGSLPPPEPFEHDKRFALFRTELPLDLAATARVVVRPACWLTLVDFFESGRPYSATDAGLGGRAMGEVLP